MANPRLNGIDLHQIFLQRNDVGDALVILVPTIHNPVRVFQTEGRPRLATSSREEFAGFAYVCPTLKKLEILITYLITII